MIYEEYRGSFLTGYTMCSQRLADTLEVARSLGSVDNLPVSKAVARQLGISDDIVDEMSPNGGWRMLLSLVPHLDAAAAERPDLSGEDRRLPEDIARAVTEELDTETLIRCATQLGWSKFASPVTLYDLVEVVTAVEQSVAFNLAQGLRRLFGAWQSADIWSIPERKSEPIRSHKASEVEKKDPAVAEAWKRNEQRKLRG